MGGLTLDNMNKIKLKGLTFHFYNNWFNFEQFVFIDCRINSSLLSDEDTPLQGFSFGLMGLGFTIVWNLISKKKKI